MMGNASLHLNWILQLVRNQQLEYFTESVCCSLGFFVLAVVVCFLMIFFTVFCFSVSHFSFCKSDLQEYRSVWKFFPENSEAGYAKVGDFPLWSVVCVRVKAGSHKGFSVPAGISGCHGSPMALVRCHPLCCSGQTLSCLVRANFPLLSVT